VSSSLPRFLGLGAALFVSVGVGCHESGGAQPTTVTPSQPAPAPSAVEPAPALGSTPIPAAASASSTPGATTAATASAAAQGLPVPSASSTLSAVAVPETAPPLFDAQGEALGQTDERPTLSSPSFQKRIAAVAQAIISGEVEPALPAFFPLVAYQQVKDVAKPERDYKFRLLANFKRDITEYHRALGSAAAESKFEGVTVSEKDAKWMAPGSEGNRLGYFRVLRSRLRFTLPTGRTRDFELTSLISWRGEWYLVHLHGFK